MRKRIIAVAAACVVMAQTFPGYALEIEQVYYEGESVHISGTAEEKLDALMLQIYKEGSGVDGSSIENGTAFEKFIYTDADGNFSDSVNLGSWMPGGEYTVRVLGEGTEASSTLMYINSDEAAEVLTRLNEADTSADFAGILEESAEALGISEEEYEQKKTVLNDYLYNQKPQNGYTLDDFIKSRQYASFIYDLKNTNTEFSTLLSNYEMYLDTELTDELKNTDSSTLAKLREYLADEDYTETSFEDAVRQNLLVARLQNCERYTQMQEIMEDLLPELGFDLTDYNRVNDKADVYRKMYEAKAQISDYASVRSVFEQAAQDAFSEQSSNTGTTGGSTSSGGNSNGGYTVSTGNGTNGVTPTQPPQSTEQGFSDIKGHWAEEDINILVSQHIINGYEDGTFLPDQSVTRAEFTKMVISAFNIPAVSGVSPFADVAADAWYAPAVAAAAQNGLVYGDGDYFLPNDLITRQDAATILYRAAEYAGITLSGDNYTDFLDSGEISDYAEEPVNNMASSGILLGSDGYFRPLSFTTRAETAAMLVRMMDIAPVDSSDIVQSVSNGNEERVTTLMERLSLTDLVSGKENQITRLEFAVTLAQFLGLQTNASEASSFFEDVTGEYSGLIDAAADTGIITKQDHFNPDDPILYQDALRMCLAAAGYSSMITAVNDNAAQIMDISNRLDLTERVGSVSPDSGLSSAQALNIIYNTITVDIMEQVSFSVTNTFETIEGQTILSKYFDIYRTEGIVTANSRTGLSSAGDSTGEGRIRIDSDTYYASHDEDEMLGYNVEAFFQDSMENPETIIAAFPYRSSSQGIDGVDINSFENNRIIVDRENGTRRISMNTNYDVIYNGKAINEPLSNELLMDCGEVILIDNDNDSSRYEVAVVRTPVYLQVGSVNSVNNIIQDKSLYNNQLDFSGDNCEYTIYDEEGNEIAIYDITDDSVLEAYVSRDGEYAEVYVCGESVYGTIQSIDMTDRTINISDAEYNMASAFIEAYSGISPGETGDAYLDTMGKVVFFLSEGSGMHYGYIIMQYTGDDGEERNVRLLCDDGEIVDVKLAENVTVDGVSVSYTDADAEIEEARSISGLVRYSINSNNELSIVDTARYDNRGSDAIGAAELDAMGSNDRLTLYSFDSDTSFSSYQYKSGSGMLSPKVNLDSATVFVVPESGSSTSKDDYTVTNRNFFYNDQVISRSNLQIFDIDRDGSSGAVLYFGDTNKPAVNNTNASAVIAKVYNAVNEDNEECLALDLYINEVYRTLYTDPDMDINSLKESGNSLCAGDVVRIGEVNGIIKNMIVDFDASANVMSSNSKSPVSFNSASGINIQYQTGKIYSVSDSSVYITPQPPGSALRNDTFDFAFGTLRQFFVGSRIVKVTMLCSEDEDGNITVTNTDVSPCELSDVDTYLTAGENADYAVIRQAYLDTSTMIIYHIERS